VIPVALWPPPLGTDHLVANISLASTVPKGGPLPVSPINSFLVPNIHIFMYIYIAIPDIVSIRKRTGQKYPMAASSQTRQLASCPALQPDNSARHGFRHNY